MTQEYEIVTIADFLALTQEQRARCAVDLVAWANFVDAALTLAPGVFQPPQRCIWVDDSRAGEVSGVVLSDQDGNLLHRVDFPATGEAAQ